MKNTSLCYIEKDGKYLMLHRTKKQNDANKDKWIGIGGKFEDKESPEECMLREIFEETGIKAEVSEFLFDMPDDYEYRGVDLYPLDFFFKCKIIDMTSSLLDETENSEMMFLYPEEINPDDFGLISNRLAVKKYFNK